MRYTSYSFLIPVTCLVLAGLTGIVLWQVKVIPVTFLRSSTLRYTLLVASAIALVAALPLQRCRIKAGLPVRWTDPVMLFFGGLIAAFALLYLVVTTLTFWLPGTQITYTATYTYNQGGAKTCRSATVIDPVLARSINICRPMGIPVDYQILRVHERVNALGIVTLYSLFVPDTVADRPKGFYPFNPARK